MKTKIRIMLPIITLLVIALSGSVSAAAQTSVTPQSPAAATSSYFIPIVDKNGTAVLSGAASSSATSSAGSTTSVSTTASPYAPQPGDSALIRDKVLLDYSKSHLIVTSSTQLSVEAYIVGNLPDPCHVLRITSSQIATGQISINVYSLVKPGTACITVLKPFAVTYSLGSFPAGQYTVLLNGTRLGTFGSITPSGTALTP